MNSTRVRWVLVGLVYLALIVATVWLGSLDTLAQADAIYPASLLVLLTAALAVRYAVWRYQRLDELSQRIHLTALAVGFVGFFIIVFTVALLQFSRLFDQTDFWFYLTRPNQPMRLGLQTMGLMAVLYLIGWFWGRSRYR